MSDNPYSPPRAEVSDPEPPERPKPGAGARFVWTAGVTFAVFVVLVVLVAPGSWYYGALGSAAFAICAGLIAMCIPVRNKAGFIIPAMFIVMVVAWRIGSKSH